MLTKITALVIFLALSVTQPRDLTLQYSLSRPETKLYGFVNKARVKFGLNKLTLSSTLSQTARKHAKAMASKKKLWHTQVNCWIWGQNVGAGTNAWLLFKAFMNSPDHRANMLGNFNRIGVGAARSSDGILFASLDFCR